MIDSLEYKPNLKEAVARMKRFWNLEEPLDRVPVEIYLPMSDERKADGSFFGRLNEYMELMEEYFKRHSEVDDEYFPQLAPQYGHAAISALCGSQIKVLSHTVWSVPFIDDLAMADDLFIDWENDWGKRFREDYEIIIERSKGKYATGPYEIEGVSDTYSALRGPEKMFYDFYDNPSGAHKLAGRITDILIEFGKWCNKNIAQRQNILGGLTNVYGIWMPEDSCITTEDASVMYSRQFYCSYIKEHTQRLASAFNKTLIEVHDEGTHQIKEFGDTRGIDLMTINNPLKMDAEHRNDIRNLLGKRAFRIGAEPDEIEELLEFTGLKGILLATTASSVESARKILENIMRITQKLKKKSKEGE